jgi:hypothetical protein
MKNKVYLNTLLLIRCPLYCKGLLSQRQSINLLINPKTVHNEAACGDPTQDLLFVNAFRWIVSRDPNGDPFQK